MEEVKFADDSLLEEDGFEPLVPPGLNASVSTGFASWRGGRSLFRKAPVLGGTGSSNPSSSSGESAATSSAAGPLLVEEGEGIGVAGVRGRLDHAKRGLPVRPDAAELPIRDTPSLPAEPSGLEDDLVGKVLGQEPWEVVSFPAIAEADEVHEIATIWGPECFTRWPGEALHPAREPLATLEHIRRTIGEYNFAGQYQQSPTPLGGGLVKEAWFKRYGEHERPERFAHIVQSWDTANKATDLSDFSVCTTWGVRDKKLYLLGLLRQRLNIRRSSARCASSRACSMRPRC
jgi:hypothetical protein